MFSSASIKEAFCHDNGSIALDRKYHRHMIKSDIIFLKRGERGREPASRNGFQILHILEAWLQRGIVNISE